MVNVMREMRSRGGTPVARTWEMGSRTDTPAAQTRQAIYLRRNALDVATALMDATSYTLRRLPPPIRYLPADAVTLPLTRLALPHKAVIERNFAVMLGLPDDHPRVRSLARASVENFGRMAIDYLGVRTMTADEVLTWVSSRGEEYLSDALGGGRGVILALPHLGSWDVAAAFAQAFGCRLTVVTESDWMADLVAGSRSGTGLTLVPRDRSLRMLFRTLARNDCVAMLSDIAADGLQAAQVPFFGRPAPFPTGPARLSRRTGASILVVSSVRLPDKTYRVEAQPPLRADPDKADLEDIRDLTAAMAAGFERVVAAYPEQWYPFHPIWNAPSTVSRS